MYDRDPKILTKTRTCVNCAAEPASDSAVPVPNPGWTVERDSSGSDQGGADLR